MMQGIDRSLAGRSVTIDAGVSVSKNRPTKLPDLKGERGSMQLQDSPTNKMQHGQLVPEAAHKMGQSNWQQQLRSS